MRNTVYIPDGIGWEAVHVPDVVSIGDIADVTV